MGKASTKAKKKKKKAKSQKVASAATGATSSVQSDASSAAVAATEYLTQWVARAAPAAAWKFSKTRQTFLLKGWPHRNKVAGDTFKLLLSYLQTLPHSTAQRTIEQAREVAASTDTLEQSIEARAAARKELVATIADGDEEDEEDGAAAEADEEKRAELKIQRARALRVLNALLAPASGQLTPTAAPASWPASST